MSESAKGRLAQIADRVKSEKQKEEERMKAIREARQQEQNKYDKSAEKFRQDIKDIGEVISEQNEVLESSGISLRSDGGKAQQGGFNRLRLTISIYNDGKIHRLRLLFSLEERGLELSIITTPSGISRKTECLDISTISRNEYADAIADFVEQAFPGDE